MQFIFAVIYETLCSMGEIWASNALSNSKLRQYFKNITARLRNFKLIDKQLLFDDNLLLSGETSFFAASLLSHYFSRRCLCNVKSNEI